MKFTRHILPGFLSTVLLITAARAQTEHPYGAIITRNAFGLVPIPTNRPVDPTPVTPPPKITPNGIMDIFGKLQALFKVALPAKGTQPAHDESYVLSVGEEQDEIGVVKIDKKAGLITFNNHGTSQELPLVAGVASGGAAPAGGAPGGGSGIGSPPPGQPSGFNPIANRFGRNPNAPKGNLGDPGLPNAGSNPNLGAPGGGGNNANNPQSQESVSLEGQVLMIEAQRMKFQADGNPAASILPPTPITKQLNDENGQSGGGNPIHP